MPNFQGAQFLWNGLLNNFTKIILTDGKSQIKWQTGSSCTRLWESFWERLKTTSESFSSDSIVRDYYQGDIQVLPALCFLHNLVEAHCYGKDMAGQFLSKQVAVKQVESKTFRPHEVQHCNWRRPSWSKRLTFNLFHCYVFAQELPSHASFLFVVSSQPD